MRTVTNNMPMKDLVPLKEGYSQRIGVFRNYYKYFAKGSRFSSTIIPALACMKNMVKVLVLAPYPHCQNMTPFLLLQLKDVIQDQDQIDQPSLPNHIM
jgi:hypothetical protein